MYISEKRFGENQKFIHEFGIALMAFHRAIPSKSKQRQRL